jgi:hypothetical protein
MSTDDIAGLHLPAHLSGSVPTVEQILKALASQSYTYERSRIFVRAVDDEKFLGTANPHKPHRFGPPLDLVSPTPALLPFTWVYVALSDIVAVWESQLVKNRRGAGNGFFITRKAEESGKLARVVFARTLRLWNLGQEHSSRLGIHDIVTSDNHEACQWLGCRIRAAMLTLPKRSRPDGFVYPSRRVPGHPALALADWATPTLFKKASVAMVPFAGSSIHAHLSSDSMLTDGPELDAHGLGLNGPH